jgi:hypothetical protein
MADKSEKAEAMPKKKFAEFLESTPPSTVEGISDLFFLTEEKWLVSGPDLQLHCSSEACQGARFFRCVSNPNILRSRYANAERRGRHLFMTYRCSNCQDTEKTYALLVVEDGDRYGRAAKFGELPPFGPPVPSRVISLVGPDRDLFLRGRGAENQGLGIGAFAYYRRVVENQKGRIIAEIGKVAERLRAGEEAARLFQNAAKETQFSRAIDQVKDAIPESLLIHGQNPLLLLHSALSEWLHAHTDEECLEIAQDIRIVLTELADRISQALKDEAELKQSVSRLLSRRTGDTSSDAEGAATGRVGLESDQTQQKSK